MLRDYFRSILRYWWLVLLPLVIVAAVTLVRQPVAVPSYQVTMRYATGLEPERTPGVYNYDRQYVWLASEYVAAALDNSVRTSLFAQNVASRAAGKGLQVAADQIQASIAADHKQSELIVYLSWPDATQAVDIANQISAELTERGSTYWPQLATATSAPVIALDQPVAVATAPPLRDRFDVPVRILLAVAAGVALAWIANSLDPRLHGRNELEQMGIRIIGEIPRDGLSTR